MRKADKDKDKDRIEREEGSEREREKQRGRQTSRVTQSEGKRQTDRQAYKQRDTGSKRY